LLSLLPQAPLYIVWLIGIVVAIRNLHRFQRPAILALIALLVSLLASLVGGVMSTPLLIFFHTRMGLSFERIGIINFAVQVAQSIILALGWAIILFATFTGRSGQTGSRPPSAD
jgi:hypothetical protein